MLLHPATPGAYVQPIDADRGEILSLRTDIAGFVGIAERGPIGVAVAIETMRQFEAIFGGYIGGGYLAYAVRAFFENGGRRCRVVRVAAPEAAAARCTIDQVGGGVGLSIEASSPGAWGNALSVSLRAAWRAETLSKPGTDMAAATPVLNTDGFAPGCLVRASQSGLSVFRILAEIDPVQRRLHWLHPEPERRRPYERVLTGFDFDQPIRFERLDYDIAVRQRGELLAVYAALSLSPQAQRFAPTMLRLPDYGTTDQLPWPPAPIVVTLPERAADWIPQPLDIVDGAVRRLAGGLDGLATLSPEDFIGESASTTDSPEMRAVKQRGLAALAIADDVAILAVPDIVIQPIRPPLVDPVVPPPADPCDPCVRFEPPAPLVPRADPELPPVFDENAVYRVQSAMIAQCEALRDRFALIDPPYRTANIDRLGIGPVSAWRSRFDSAFAALYFPWVAVADPLGVAPVRLVPPSGHVAGQFAATDLSIGVHKAAANQSLTWVQDASVAINATVHGMLNNLGINVLRAREGRLLRILGARTMSSDPVFSFVPVRRLLSMVREALDVGTQWAVFEPNNAATRLAVTQAVTEFLTQLWLHGALAGDQPDAAFRVRCDEDNNPADRRANGEFHVDLAIAPSVPFEFIILRMGRRGQSFELVEDGGASRAFIGGDL